MKLSAQEEEQRVLDANIKLHDFGAENFDNYPPWIMRDLARRYKKGAQYIRSLFQHKPLALDAGCGRGGLALAFIEAGCKVDINDISSEMVRLTLKKINRKQRNTHATTQDINALLREHVKKKKTYDIIYFAAILHHIYDYKETMCLAAKILNPGGVLFICGEPELLRKKKSFLAQLHTMAVGLMINVYKLFRNPAHAYRFIKSRMDKNKETFIDVDTAEYHASKGVDERAIQKVLFTEGMCVINYERWGVNTLSVFGLMDLLLKNERQVFSLIAINLGQKSLKGQ